MDQLAVTVAAWEQTAGAVLDLGAELGEADWAARTECPGWTVKDIYAHLVAGELWMAAGHPAPAAGLASIAGPPVTARRQLAPELVLAELRQAVALRGWQLAHNRPDPEQPTQTAFGLPVTVGTLHLHRAFDTWVHEQDIRRAVGRPGNLGTPAAELSSHLVRAALPRQVAKLAQAPAGSTVRVTVEGPVAFDHAVVTDDTGRATLRPWAAGADPLSHITLGWEAYARLTAGRVTPDAVPATVTGDRALADRLLRNLTITP